MKRDERIFKCHISMQLLSTFSPSFCLLLNGNFRNAEEIPHKIKCYLLQTSGQKRALLCKNTFTLRECHIRNDVKTNRIEFVILFVKYVEYSSSNSHKKKRKKNHSKTWVWKHRVICEIHSCSSILANKFEMNKVVKKGHCHIQTATWQLQKKNAGKQDPLSLCRGQTTSKYTCNLKMRLLNSS